jgi:hypothetical protein
MFVVLSLSDWPASGFVAMSIKGRNDGRLSAPIFSAREILGHERTWSGYRKNE